MRRPSRLLAVLAMWVTLCAPAKAASDDLSIGLFSTAIWYACSDQRVAENIAQTFVTRGGAAAITLFNQNALLCDITMGPTKLYVHSVVWSREMDEGEERMKVVLMSEWNENRLYKHYYVLTQRTVLGSGVAELENAAAYRYGL